MRNDQARASTHDAAKLTKNLFLGISVNGRERVIENKNSWLTHDCPSNRCSLFLSTRKSDASFPDKRVVTIRESFDVLSKSGNTRRPLNLSAISVLNPESNVFLERVAKQK